MKTTLIILAGLILIVLCVKLITKRTMPKTIESIDRGQYELLLGCDAKQVFLYYRVTLMHGLSLKGAEKRMAEGGSYIDGLCNYNPRDKDLSLKPLPFLFLNIKSLQSHEEEMVTWAEAEANRIIAILQKKKFI